MNYDDFRTLWRKGINVNFHAQRVLRPFRLSSGDILRYILGGSWFSNRTTAIPLLNSENFPGLKSLSLIFSFLIVENLRTNVGPSSSEVQEVH